MFIFNINKANLVVNKSEYDKAIDQGLFDSFFKKMGQPRPLFCLFTSFQTNITIF